MNDLHDLRDLQMWLAGQHHGLRTFKTFQDKLTTLSRREPGQRALYALLGHLVGRYVEAYDEEPLPVATADRAHARLVELVASLDPQPDADRHLADINRVAACDLLH
jgi:hypothetical protein